MSNDLTRPTEETRLTSQSGSSFNGKSGAFYYTGSFDGQDDDGEESKSLGRMLDCGNSNTSHSENFALNDSVMDFILREDSETIGTTQHKSQLLLKSKAGNEDAQSGSGDAATNLPKEEDNSNDEKIEFQAESEEPAN